MSTPKRDEAEDADDRDAPAFMRKLTPSPELAAIVGASPLPRVQVVMKIWTYIKEHRCQDRKNSRVINADELLRPIFGADRVNIFELTKRLNRHLR